MLFPSLIRCFLALFYFISTKFLFSTANKYLKVEACGTFDDMRLEQRFEVMNEELSSVCSKFAHGNTSMSFYAQNVYEALFQVENVLDWGNQDA